MAGSLGCLSRRGFTLVEVTLAAACLGIAMLALTVAYLSAVQLDEVNKQAVIATQSARLAMEEIPAENFATLYSRYNSDPFDDPGGAGTAPGSRYPALNSYWTVNGLSLAPGSCFPVNEMTGLLGPAFNVPGGGSHYAIGRIEFPNYNAKDTLHEVHVRVVWKGPNERTGADVAPDGTTQIQLVTLMTQRFP